MRLLRVVAQIFNLLYRRIAFCGALETTGDPAFSTAWPIANRRNGRLKICATGAALATTLFGVQLNAQQPDTNNPTVRFRAVDIFVDAQDQPLAVYQLEFSVTNANAGAKIVGIEGGEHPAFAEPPFYDPKAMQQERVIIAAFSTNAVSQLPSGKTRVATIHLQTRGAAEPELLLKLRVAADANGNKIPAEASAEERKAK